MQCDENTCKVCLAQYMSTDDEELPWVMCDSCNMWMFIYHLSKELLSAFNTTRFVIVCTGT